MFGASRKSSAYSHERDPLPIRDVCCAALGGLLMCAALPSQTYL